MASIIEAFEDTIVDNFSVIKTLILAIPVYYSYILYTSEKYNELYICAGVTGIVLFLLMMCIFNNVRNSNNAIFPSVKQFLLFGLKSLFCVVPISFLLGFCAFKLCSIEIPFSQFQTTYQIIICVLFASINIMSIMQFARTGKIQSAFDIVAISTYCIDILIRVLFMLLLLVIFNLLTLGIITYVVWAFMPLENPLYIAICSVFFVANLFAIAHYLAQVDYEVVRGEEKEHII